ncbi:MAG: hypothetical protein V1772_10070 [Chloroflexota bacterium]
MRCATASRRTGGEPIGDHDLFYETIPAPQAQDYVRLVYEQYDAYARLYRAPANAQGPTPVAPGP